MEKRNITGFSIFLEMKIGLKSLTILFAAANGYGLLKACPNVRDAKWEALVLRQLKNLMKTRNDYQRKISGLRT